MKANWLPVSRHWDFPQINEKQESSRTGRTKNCPNSATERSSTESRPLLQRCFGSVGTELNCQTSSFLDFPLKIYSASLQWRLALLWIVHRKSRQEENNKRRLQVGSGVTELLNVQLICFPMSYGTIYICLHSWFCRICVDWATARLFVSATDFFALWRRWRMNTARVIYLWTRLFHLGPSILPD